MNNDPDVVLKTENGLISIAMQMYAESVLQMGGDVALYDRAMEIHYKFKDLDKDEQTPI